MKYYKRLNLYKASNVVYDPSTGIATSYDWWQFVKPFGNKVVFNDYTYSNTTAKHQSKVRWLLHTLDIAYFSIQAPDGLQNLDSAITFYKNAMQASHNYINKPRIRKTTKQRLQREIAMYAEKLALVKVLMNCEDK